MKLSTMLLVIGFAALTNMPMAKGGGQGPPRDSLPNGSRVALPECSASTDFAYLFMSDTEHFSLVWESDPENTRSFQMYKTWAYARDQLGYKCFDTTMAYDGLAILGDLYYEGDTAPSNNNAFAECYELFVTGEPANSPWCVQPDHGPNYSSRIYEVMGNHDAAGGRGLIPAPLRVFVNRGHDDFGSKYGTTRVNQTGYHEPGKPHYGFTNFSGGFKVHFIAVGPTLDNGTWGDAGSNYGAYDFLKNYLEEVVGDTGERVFVLTHADFMSFDTNPDDDRDNRLSVWLLLAPYNASIINGHLTYSYAQSHYTVRSDGYVYEWLGHHQEKRLDSPENKSFGGGDGAIAQAYAETNSYRNRLFLYHVGQAGGKREHGWRRIHRMTAGGGWVDWTRITEPYTVEATEFLIARNIYADDLSPRPTPKSCSDIKQRIPDSPNGTYTVWPRGAARFFDYQTVTCEMDKL